AQSTGNRGGILGKSLTSDASLSSVTSGYYWAHAGLPSACIGSNDNVTDPVTCNDIGNAAFYQTFSNFTSATSVYTNWDFTNTWKFPSAGGLPILKWQYEP
ncbi:MAG: hypothetical protein NTV34_19675, partial [Proteobacteria bacterium]|nr:hypothetical protein [Pseudomonadota bacterium]MCX6126950.1 hypothetical protein [Pseudomonadota bacterium]